MLPSLLLLLLSAIVHGSATDPPQLDLRSKPLILVKIWCLVIVFIVSFLAGVSPYLMKWNEGFILLGTQFAGGVFLGAALMDFLSDSGEVFGKLSSKNYPFAFMLACFGYMLAMLADCIMLYIYRKRESTEYGGGSAVQGRLHQRKTSSGVGTSRSQIQVVDSGIHDYMDPLFFSAISFGDSVMLIIVLCFHSIFEGIAIGTMETKRRAWRALWIVSLHKVFAAIALGIAILRVIPDRPLLSCVAYAFVFAISSPIGVAIGIVMDATTQGIVADWIYAISMALSCGVFVYISSHHLIFKGYKPQRMLSVDTPHHKFLAVLLGIGVIAIVLIWNT
ncbi:unnamed protein product [Ilex paraguariensis]|uniref:Zinc transporter 11 n=1 Tax=Ilex paraguariensis TaxID=185542 RepID=A0ABC8RQZ4_9AQUA